MITTFITAVLIFTVLILLMTISVIYAEKKLSRQGTVSIVVNGDQSKAMTVEPSGTLLSVLASNGLFIPSACGGGGTCGMCKVKVHSGAGEVLPTEIGHLSRSERKENVRLSCQVKVRDDLQIEVPDELFSIREFECEVVSNHNVATFIKEFVIKLPPGEDLNHKSGGYIQIEIPPHDIDYKNFDVESEYREDWDKFNIWNNRSVNEEKVIRAYSMANHPAEGNIVMLNVRIATPPPRSTDIPPGKASSYIFNLKPGDKVNISGPYGEFFINKSEKEMCYIGGGAGMAPLRSHLFHLFHTEKTNRKVSFWYGARSSREIFYQEDFDGIAKDFPNFNWNVALSDALPEDNWTGYKGFIHQVLLDNYLKNHEDPTEIEYYMCGPPMMIDAVVNMLDSLGVEPEQIRYDKF